MNTAELYEGLISTDTREELFPQESATNINEVKLAHVEWRKNKFSQEFLTQLELRRSELLKLCMNKSISRQNCDVELVEANTITKILAYANSTQVEKLIS